MQLDYPEVEKLLKIKHISKRRLSEELGLQENTVTAAFRRGSKKTFTDEDIVKIATLLGVEVPSIVTGTIENPAYIETTLPNGQKPKLVNESLIELLSTDILLQSNNGIQTLTQKDKQEIIWGKVSSERMPYYLSKKNLQRAIMLFDALNGEGQKKALDTLESLVINPEYQRWKTAFEVNLDSGEITDHDGKSVKSIRKEEE